MKGFVLFLEIYDISLCDHWIALEFGYFLDKRMIYNQNCGDHVLRFELRVILV